jgi:hypothetical protein
MGAGSGLSAVPAKPSAVPPMKAGVLSYAAPKISMKGKIDNPLFAFDAFLE